MKKTRDAVLDKKTDEELCALVSGGGEDSDLATECLLLRYRDLVRAWVRSFFLVGGDSEDLMQEGMIGLYKAVRDYTPDRTASFRTFAELCVRRQVMTAVTSATRDKHAPLNNYVSFSAENADSEGVTVGDAIADSLSDPEQMVMESESFRLIRERIGTFLSSYENKVLDMYLEGYPYARIAEILNKEPKSVDNALQRIKSKVSGRLPGLLTKKG